MITLQITGTDLNLGGEKTINLKNILKNSIF